MDDYWHKVELPSDGKLNNAQTTRIDSNSDSDWDDDDFGSKKINICIKPIGQQAKESISASVDELRATVGTWKSMANINLTKPNSRRHHASTLYLANTASNLDYNSQQQTKSHINLYPQPANLYIPQEPKHMSRIVLPIAFAAQETLNAHIVSNEKKSTNSITGQLILAVPKSITDMKISSLNQCQLSLSISSLVPISKVKPNEQIVFVNNEIKANTKEIGCGDIFTGLTDHRTEKRGPNLKILIDLINLQAKAKQLQQQSMANQNSYLLIDLFKYHISNDAISAANHSMVPFNISSRWHKDPLSTKLRIDYMPLSTDQHQAWMTKFGIPFSESIVRDIKVKATIPGQVSSHQSKPEACWHAASSQLIWSFANLGDLLNSTRISTSNGLQVPSCSCLARFDLLNGPSEFCEVELSFSIVDTSLAGIKVSLTPNSSPLSYKITKFKTEVRTGKFTIETIND